MNAAFPLGRGALRDLPGAELVLAGLDALAALGANSDGERRSPARSPKEPAAGAPNAPAPEFPIEALLVAIGARRLRRAGVRVPEVPGLPDQPELALYEALARQDPAGDAHSRYNALVRRLVSFERAAEALSARMARAAASRL